MMWLHAGTLVCVFTVSLLVRGVLADDPPPKWRYDDPISGETLYCDWCKPGEYMNRPCTEHSPTECIPCPWEHYTEYYNQELECLLCQQCNLKDHEHEHEALPCTAEQNRQCECDDGYYMLLEFCRPHSECPIGHGVKEKGTPWKNTRCMRCRTGTFSDEDSSTAECTSHTNCTARGECVVQQGNRKRDNLCGACAVNGTVTNSSVSDATQVPPIEDGNATGYEGPPPWWLDMGALLAPVSVTQLGLVMFVAVIIVVAVVALWRDDPTVQRKRSLPTRHSLTEIFVKRASQSSMVGAAGTSEPQQPLLEGDTTRRSSQEKAAWRASHTTAAKRFQRGLSVEEEERTPSLTSDEELSHVKVALSHAEHIAEDIGAEWRALGRKLGFTDGQCDCFQNDYQGLKEITYQMLRKWVDEKGEDATLGTLGNALVQVEKEDVRSKLFTFEHETLHPCIH
ncbi:tumor necrosis factor receptor superfamily member 10B-like [Branchiostoma lanceolatum]|uniref:tumor necrosis factor receptor superfamily member 10B-like n=1 Tax=Branchiostoma lanceolatum TaxID=7740 RepID=UPI0034554E4A